MIKKKIIRTFLLIVFAEGCCYASESPQLQERTVDIGGNLTLPCTDSDTLPPVDASRVMWVRDGREQINRKRIQPGGGLSLTVLNREDAGIYSCLVDSKSDRSDEDMDVRTRVKVEVRTPPPPLVNVTVHPSTVLALLLWEVADDGGYEITYFTVRYRQKYTAPNEKPDEWHPVTYAEHIIPNARKIDVYRLKPNTTYEFRIWANNRLGKGNETELEATTLHDTEEIELARHLLEGAENFDTRVWVAAVAVVMGTLLMLALGTCYLLYKECHIPSMHRDEQEIIELVPNIILNPGFYDGDTRTEEIEPDENSNNQTTTRINNNTIVQPIRV